MPILPAILKDLIPIGPEATYLQVRYTSIRIVLEHGRYRWGGRDIFDSGRYRATPQDPHTYLIDFYSSVFRGEPKRCQLTRRGKTYVLKVLPHGEELKLHREDGELFLEDSSKIARRRTQPAPATTARKMIEPAAAQVSYQLTGESVLHATTIPERPNSKSPTTIRISHTNSYGWIDADIFVRLGDPKNPTSVQNFNAASDWKKTTLIEDMVWNDKHAQWLPRTKAKRSTTWCGTYEATLQFPKGHHRIELKIISRIPEVRSVVLSNWKLHAR